MLVVMVKAPICGLVKTRLARDIGFVAATAIYRRLTKTLLREVAGDPRFDTMLAIAPDHFVSARFEAWTHDGIGSLPRITQGRGDLGGRMRRIFDGGRGPILIVGSDIPFVTRDMIANAFKALGRSDIVLGPAEDGGYWLIGVRGSARRTPSLARVRWSTEHALADTVAVLAPRSVAFAPTLFDVDTVADLRRYLQAVAKHKTPPKGGACHD